MSLSGGVVLEQLEPSDEFLATARRSGGLPRRDVVQGRNRLIELLPVVLTQGGVDHLAFLLGGSHTPYDPAKHTAVLAAAQHQQLDTGWLTRVGPNRVAIRNALPGT